MISPSVLTVSLKKGFTPMAFDPNGFCDNDCYTQWVKNNLKQVTEYCTMELGRKPSVQEIITKAEECWKNGTQYVYGKQCVQCGRAFGAKKYTTVEAKDSESYLGFGSRVVLTVATTNTNYVVIEMIPDHAKWQCNRLMSGMMGGYDMFNTLEECRNHIYNNL